MPKRKRFLFVTGQTGGHIFPILSVAHPLHQAGHSVYIVSGNSPLEKKILSNQPFTVYPLSVGRLQKGVAWKERFCTLLLMPIYMVQSFWILLKIKPDRVMGCGGSVSGPVLLIACLLRYPTAIWELNAKCGLTNKILSKWVDCIFIHFEEVKKYFPEKKCFLFLFSARTSIQTMGSRPRESDGYSHLLILGGSQGAHVINQAVLDMYHQQPLDTWKIVHQTGEKDFASIQSIYSKKETAQCYPFLDNVGEWYQWADLVIARAGASTLSELCACGKASILIPFASSDGHQKANATSFFQKEASELLLEKELTGASLFEMVMSIHGKKKRKLETNIKKWYDPDSLEKIIHHLMIME